VLHTEPLHHRARLDIGHGSEGNDLLQAKRVEGEGDTTLNADGEQLKTCFSNLMINALQAMPNGGALGVTLRPEPSQLVIEFTDTGHGIPPGEIEQIFEPYYSTKDTGIGLGLPLTRKIIEEHGGTISVTSEPGRGTTFTVALPREAVQAVPVPGEVDIAVSGPRAMR